MKKDEEEHYSSENLYETEEEYSDYESPYEEDGKEPYDDETPSEEERDDSGRSGNFFSHGILHIAFVLVLLLCIGLVVSVSLTGGPACRPSLTQMQTLTTKS